MIYHIIVLYLVPLGETSFQFYESLPLLLSNDNNLISSTMNEPNDKTQNSLPCLKQDLCSSLPNETKSVEGIEETNYETMETLAKVLPPPNQSTFYIPITKSSSKTSTVVSSTKGCTKLLSSGPSSPLGEVADTVISGTMTGLHAVVGLPSAVSAHLFDSEESVPEIPLHSTSEGQTYSCNEGGDTREPQWSCAECTFLNHPALKECEQCEMPRVMIGTDLQRAHLAKNCFCHPQDIPLKNQPPSTSQCLPFSVSSNNPTSSSFPLINRTNINPNEDTKTNSRDNSQSEKLSTNFLAESSKVQAILTKSVDTDDSPPSESSQWT